MKLIRNLTPEDEYNMKKSMFAGRLVIDDELANTLIKAPVVFQDEMNEFIAFYIKCLSPIPKELEKYFQFPNKILTGSTRSYNNIHKIRQNIPDYDRLLPVDRKEKLKNELQNKLILFTLIQLNSYLFVEIVKIEDVYPKKNYALIPGPEIRLGENREDLESRILSGSPIVLPQYPNVFNDPDFIFYDNFLYSNFSLKRSENPTTYYVTNPEDVKRMPITSNFIEMIEARSNDYLYFIDDELMAVLRDEVNIYGKHLIQAVPADMGKKEIETDQSMTENHENGDSIDTVTEPHNFHYHEEEIKFIEQLEENAKSRGLYYDVKDLYNFHISVKTNLLTIIGGMSGTGKTQLAQLYGETLGLKFGKELLVIPVSPSYHEPNDVLGYLNPTSGIYHESETGLVRLLLEAEKNPEKLYMVIFDEMNLSQIEHWFSPFISLLELEVEKRQLSLFSENSYSVNEKYKAKVNIGENLIFAGTVNFDETTKNFSDRLLDRVNVVIPNKLRFKDVIEKYQAKDPANTFKHFDINSNLFRGEWISVKNDELENLTEGEIRILDQLHEKLQENDVQKGVSFRVARRIANYLGNIPTYPTGKEIIPRHEAFDIQIKQRILSKINGLESSIGNLVGNYHGDQYEEGIIVSLLQSPESQQIASFKQSIELLKNKAKELMRNGFAN